MSTKTTDRIEKQTLLRAPCARVWRALADSREFGDWFRIQFTEPFRVGATLRGRITHPGYEHLVVDFTIEAMESEWRLAYRWHPNAVDTKRNYSKEPKTLVEFILEDAPGADAPQARGVGFRWDPARSSRRSAEGQRSGLDRADHADREASPRASLTMNRRINRLTEGMELTRQGVTKHLRVLADAGLRSSPAELDRSEAGDSCQFVSRPLG